MFKPIKGSVKGYRDSIVSYTLLKQENVSNTLGIVLPGMGYTTQGPLLHYATSLLLNEGYDVLQIDYHYKTTSFMELSEQEKNDCIHYDVETMLHVILKQGTYTDFYLVAKSLGTIPLANELSNRTVFSHAKAVWLTPLLTEEIVFEKMKNCKQSSLIVIGDKDHFYDEEKLALLSELSNMNIVVCKDGNHSLEIAEDIVTSIDMLKHVVLEMSHFMKRVGEKV